MGDGKHENCVAYANPIKSILTPVFDLTIVDNTKRKKKKTCVSIEHSIVGCRR